MRPTRPAALLILSALLFNQGCAALRPTAKSDRPPSLNEKVRVVSKDEPISMYFLSADASDAPACLVRRVEGDFGEMHGDSLILNRVTRVDQVHESDSRCRPAQTALVLLSTPGGSRHQVERPTGGARGVVIALVLVGAVALVVALNAAKVRTSPTDCSGCVPLG